MRTFKFVVFPGNNSFIIKEALLQRGNWKEVPFDSYFNFADIDFIWSPKNLSKKEIEQIIEQQKTNPTHQIKKDIMYFILFLLRMLSQLVSTQKISGISKYDSTKQKSRTSNDVLYLRSTVNRMSGYQNQRINLKRLSLQGKGIEIFSSLNGIHNFLHTKSTFSKWIVQKYIEKPLLYNGRKFDLRVWVLFTNQGELFVYQNGYLRTSSSKYTMQNFNEAVHLTNWSVQKEMQTYERHEDGNRLPLKQGLQHIFDTQYSKNKVDYERHIYPRIKDLIIDLVCSCEKEMFGKKKLENCFELYGFDFIIDEDLRVWLIEANKNPGFGLPTDTAKALLDEMADEMISIALDPIFPPQNSRSSFKQNSFDLIYTMQSSNLNECIPKNERRSFQLSLYPISEIEPNPDQLEKRFQVINPLQLSEYEKNLVSMKIDEGKSKKVLSFRQNYLRNCQSSTTSKLPQESQTTREIITEPSADRIHDKDRLITEQFRDKATSFSSYNQSSLRKTFSHGFLQPLIPQNKEIAALKQRKNTDLLAIPNGLNEDQHTNDQRIFQKTENKVSQSLESLGKYFLVRQSRKEQTNVDAIQESNEFDEMIAAIDKSDKSSNQKMPLKYQYPLIQSKKNKQDYLFSKTANLTELTALLHPEGQRSNIFFQRKQDKEGQDFKIDSNKKLNHKSWKQSDLTSLFYDDLTKKDNLSARQNTLKSNSIPQKYIMPHLSTQKMILTLPFGQSIAHQSTMKHFKPRN